VCECVVAQVNGIVVAHRPLGVIMTIPGGLMGTQEESRASNDRYHQKSRYFLQVKSRNSATLGCCWDVEGL
jgi:hypothetical protein